MEPGTVLLGKYRIERVLGEGGMGVVALARHLQLHQLVAIKFLRPAVLGKKQIVERFLREARAAVKLRGEHVCRVQDVGVFEDGAPYMVMEYLEGSELSTLVADQTRPGSMVAVDFILQACEGLAEAHALGIVHRDIKPSNFFITRRPDGSALLKILDFGISKAPTDIELTGTDTVLGTPAYMSPEQMRSSKHVDARTDIWALGIMLYQFLSGNRPFDAPTFSAVCLKVNMDPVPPIAEPLPPGLEAVVQRCLEKDPANRYQNVAELAAALVPHAQNRARAQAALERIWRVLGLVQIPAIPAWRAGTGDITGPPTTISAGGGQLVAAPPRRRSGVIAAAVVIMAVVTLVIVVAIGSDDDASEAARSGAGSSPAADASAPAVEDSGIPNAAAATTETPFDAAPPDAGVVEAASVDAGTIAATRKAKKPRRKKRGKKRKSGDSDDGDIFGPRR